MLKGNDIRGKPTVVDNTGDQKGEVKDIIFNHDTNRLLAFVVSKGGWFSDMRMLLWSGVQKIDRDVILVRNEAQIVKAKALPHLKKILEKNHTITGTNFMTTDGRDLGRMCDIFFDESTGELLGYEVTGGMFANGSKGYAFVPAPHSLKIGEDVIFVPPATADLMEEYSRNIKQSLYEVSGSIQEASETVANKIALEEWQKVQDVIRKTAGLSPAAKSKKQKHRGKTRRKPKQ